MKYYIVDALRISFSGKPAGVCLLERELPDWVMQKIAYETIKRQLFIKERRYIPCGGLLPRLRWIYADMRHWRPLLLL